jgi:hypothetical protein
VVVSV